MRDSRIAVRCSFAFLILGIGLAACSSDDEAIPVGPGRVDVSRLVVPDDHATIGEALAVADASDTVLVRSGIYRERGLDLPAGVFLIGVDPDSVVVDASDLPISGFAILNITGDPSIRRGTRVQGVSFRGSLDRLVRVGDIERAEFLNCTFSFAPHREFALGEAREGRTYTSRTAASRTSARAKGAPLARATRLFVSRGSPTSTCERARSRETKGPTDRRSLLPPRTARSSSSTRNSSRTPHSAAAEPSMSALPATLVSIAADSLEIGALAVARSLSETRRRP